jgi:hypothetical protein
MRNDFNPTEWITTAEAAELTRDKRHPRKTVIIWPSEG